MNASPNQCNAAIAGLHLRQVVTYQPASRYWPLQWIETGIYLAFALLLAGLCFLRIRPGRPGQPDIPRHSRPAPALERSRDPRTISKTGQPRRQPRTQPAQRNNSASATRPATTWPLSGNLATCRWGGILVARFSVVEH